MVGWAAELMDGWLNRWINGEQKGPECACFNPNTQSNHLLHPPPSSSLHPVHLLRLFCVCVFVCACACINPVFITFSDTLTLAWTNPDEASLWFYYRSYHFCIWNILYGHRFHHFYLSYILVLVLHSEEQNFHLYEENIGGHRGSCWFPFPIPCCHLAIFRYVLMLLICRLKPGSFGVILQKMCPVCFVVTIFTLAHINSVKILQLQADIFYKWSKNNVILPQQFSTG